MSEGLLSTIALLYSVYFFTANKVQLRTEADWGVAIHSSVGLKGMDVMDGTKGKNKSKIFRRPRMMENLKKRKTNMWSASITIISSWLQLATYVDM